MRSEDINYIRPWSWQPGLAAGTSEQVGMQAGNEMVAWQSKEKKGNKKKNALQKLRHEEKSTKGN